MSEPRAAWISRGELGREARRRPVVDRAEGDAFVVDGGDRVAEREDLVAARVGQDRAVPAHEAMEPAELGDQLVAGPEEEVVGVAENDVRADRPHLVGVERLDRRLRPDRHEGRGRNVAVRRAEDAGARGPVGGDDLKAHGARIGIRGPGARASRRSVVTRGRSRASAKATKTASLTVIAGCSSHARSNSATCGYLSSGNRVIRAIRPRPSSAVIRSRSTRSRTTERTSTSIR